MRNTSTRRSVFLGAWLAFSLIEPRPAYSSADPPAPLEPAQAAATFRLPGSLTIELVAAEPDVADPVAVAWDELGRILVVEMGDYPTGPSGGRVKLLEDHDGDGRVDTSRVFADKLPFPTSVLPYRGGILVAAAPDILFLRDTDGDGRADERRVLFTGFGEGNQQLRVNGLTWGVDGWIYGANGRSDGSVLKVDTLEDLLQPPAAATEIERRAAERSRSIAEAVSIRQHDFRLRPDFGRFERATGFSQFGLSFDDWGNRFLSWNTVHIRHVGLEQHDLVRNPHMQPAGAVREIAEHGSTCQIFAASRTTPRFNAEQPGYMNASCGLTIYRGDALGAAYRGNAFVCEPLSNLVHRDVLEPTGTSFVARRHEDQSNTEFLTSTDMWFRPVNLAHGPDGCLYVVDFYRPSIEHPQYVRDESARARMDWRVGSDRGRIWRIRSSDIRPRAWPQVTAASSEELVQMLEHPNGWQRDTAQRLLLERPDSRVRERLADLARRSESPQARVAALYTLDALGQLRLADCVPALADRHPEVRRHAVRLAARRAQPADPQMRATLYGMADDPDPRVRLQLACALGDIPYAPGAAPEPAAAALAQIARQGIEDDWTRTAVLSSLATSAGEFLRAYLHDPVPATNRHIAPVELDFITQAAAVAGARGDPAELAIVLKQRQPGNDATNHPPPVWRTALLTGLLEGQKRAGGNPDDRARSTNIAMKQLHADAASEFQRAATLLQDPERHPASDSIHRLAAVRLLRHAPADVAVAGLRGLLQPTVDHTSMLAAAAALAELPGPHIADLILEHWPQYTPAVRRSMLGLLLSRRDHIPPLLDRLERNVVQLPELDPTQVDLLLRMSDSQTRPRVQALLSERTSSNRRAVVESYLAALELRGDRRSGAAVFTQHCMNCHAIQGRGHQVGPDLASVAGRPAAENLADILDPNRAVAPESVGYVIATKAGLVVSGRIAGESTSAITLRGPQGVEQVVARHDIEELRSTGKSVMPEGLEQSISRQDMADLLEFLRHGEPPNQKGEIDPCEQRGE